MIERTCFGELILCGWGRGRKLGREVGCRKKALLHNVGKFLFFYKKLVCKAPKTLFLSLDPSQNGTDIYYSE